MTAAVPKTTQEWLETVFNPNCILRLSRLAGIARLGMSDRNGRQDATANVMQRMMYDKLKLIVGSAIEISKSNGKQRVDEDAVRAAIQTGKSILGKRAQPEKKVKEPPKKRKVTEIKAQQFEEKPDYRKPSRGRYEAKTTRNVTKESPKLLMEKYIETNDIGKAKQLLVDRPDIKWDWVDLLQLAEQEGSGKIIDWIEKAQKPKPLPKKQLLFEKKLAPPNGINPYSLVPGRSQVTQLNALVGSGIISRKEKENVIKNGFGGGYFLLSGNPTFEQWVERLKMANKQKWRVYANKRKKEADEYLKTHPLPQYEEPKTRKLSAKELAEITALRPRTLA
jgi:hypothetical protein